MKVSQAVLDVLGEMRFANDKAFLPDVQLDRKLYVATDKVLQACGGAWNRKSKAHVFTSDAHARVELVLSTGEVQTASDIGFFPTPAKLAAELVAMADVRKGMTALEPSAGTGRIVDALLAVGAKVSVVERDPVMRRVFVDSRRYYATVAVILCDDFMEARVSLRVDLIVMNPPFCKVGLGDHLDHVRYADSLLAPGGVLVSVLPGGVLFRQDRRHRDFRAWALSRGTIEELPDDSFKESGTRVRTCVLRLKAA